MGACIRGLIDTDGSIYPKTKNHKTPTIWFSNSSPTIRRDFNKALKILGYRVSKWTAKKDRRCQGCSIGNAKDVWRYYQEIGFSNPKNVLRYILWKENGFSLPDREIKELMKTGRMGFEPMTPGLKAPCSITQLKLPG